MMDTLFAFFHLFLLLGLLVYAVISFFQGNIVRFALIFVSLTIYYFFVLHKNVKKEILRKRKSKK